MQTSLPKVLFIISNSNYVAEKVREVVKDHSINLSHFDPAQPTPLYLWEALRSGKVPVIIDLDMRDAKSRKLLSDMLTGADRSLIIGMSEDREKIQVLSDSILPHCVMKPVDQSELIAALRACQA